MSIVFDISDKQYKLLSDIISGYDFAEKNDCPYTFVSSDIYSALAPFCKKISVELLALANFYDITISGDITRCFIKNTAKYVTFAEKDFISKHFNSKSEDLLASLYDGTREKASLHLQTKDGYLELFKSYPMVMKMLVKCTENYIAGIKAAFSNIKQDMDSLQEKFNIKKTDDITLLKVFESDFHRDKSSVLLFKIDSKEIVYKARAIGHFNLLKDFFEIINDCKDYIPKYLDLRDYGYTEYVKATVPENKRDYFIGIGKILAIGYIFSTTDLISENFISCGNSPSAVDIETLITPYFYENSGLLKNELQRLLLTGAFNNESGLVCREASENSGEQTALCISEGFRELCIRVKAHSKELLKFLENDKYSSIGFRVILRATKIYDRLGAAMYSSKINSEQSYLENLLRLENTFSADRVEIARSEIAEILNGSVPFFECRMDSLGLYSYGKCVCENFLWCSPKDTLRYNILALSDKSIEYAENDVKNLILALGKNEKSYNIDNKLEFYENCQVLLHKIYSDIRESATITSNGDVYFLSYKDGEIKSCPIGLYIGNIGVAYFLSEYSYIYKDNGARQLFMQILDSVAANIKLDKTADMSFVNGLAGMLWAFRSISKRHCIDKYNKLMAKMAECMLQAKVSDQLDFYNGEAGILYVLLSEDMGEEYVQRLDMLCQMTTKDNSLAHGKMGIAFTLFSAFNYYKNEKYLQRALEIYKVLPQKYEEIGLCRGVTGYLLLTIMASAYNKDFDGDYIDKVIAENFSNKHKNINDSLCCGISGLVIALMDLSVRYKREKMLAIAEKIICERQNLSAATISLGYGSSGIGVALLKLLYPNSIDSFILKTEEY